MARPPRAASPPPDARMSERPLPISALTLRQVQYFVQVAKLGSFTQAALALSVTQPALTAAIRQIERLLGGPLFVRLPHRIELTEAGARVLPLAERLVNSARHTFDDMASTIAQHVATVHIGLIPSAADWLLPLLQQLRAREPGLRFALSDLPNDALVRRLQRGELDIGVGLQPPGPVPAGLRLHPLFDDELVAVVRRDDPLGGRIPVAWEALATRDLATFTRGQVGPSLQANAEQRGLMLQPLYRLEYVESLYALVRQSMAVAIMPGLYTRRLEDAELVALPLQPPQIKRKLVMITLAGSERSPQAACCREFIAAAATATPAQQPA